MTVEEKIRLLNPPEGCVHAVIDTDAYNEIDDQFAISYLLRSSEKVTTEAIYAAPFSFPHIRPDEGMEQSYREIERLLALAGCNLPHFRGSASYLPDEKTPVMSDAALDLARRGMEYTAEKPLYIIAIGAITNVASALLMEPGLRDRCVLVWLGGHSREMNITDEYNMKQDIAAARVVMSSGIPFIQLPCAGVVSAFSISDLELRRYFLGATPLADYLGRHALEAMKQFEGESCTRVLWDVAAVGWLLGAEGEFMYSRITPTRLPGYDSHYGEELPELPMRYVFYIKRDELMRDLIRRVCK